MTATNTQQLPQMKSIWIDEDQEAEKLYSLQAQQMLGGNDELNIRMVNSDKPELNNKRQIDLRPLTKKLGVSQSNSKRQQQILNNQNNSSHSTLPKLRSKKSILNIFRSSSVSDHRSKNKNSKNTGSGTRIISGPFDFQHISHAGGNQETNENLETPKKLNIANRTPRIEVSSESKKHQKNDSMSLNKAFVTETLRPESVVSSNYANSMHSGQHDRVMSVSTTATTFLDRTPSFNRIKHLSGNKLLTQKNHLMTSERPDSMGSNLSLNFLKNYSFPTLLEDEQVKDFHEDESLNTAATETTSNSLTPAPVMKHSKNQSLSSSISQSSSIYSSPTKSHSHKRNSSAPQSLSTPELEAFLFSDAAFKDRISVDDILRYYNTNNEGELIRNDEDANIEIDFNSQSILSVEEHPYL